MIDKDYLKECVVLIYYGNTIPLGTGFFVLPEGYILTCDHILSDNNVNLYSTDIFIQWGNKPLLECEYDSILSNPDKNIAVLKAREGTKEFPFVPLGDCTKGHEIYSWGHQKQNSFIGYRMYGVASYIKKKKDMEGIEREECIGIEKTNIDEDSSGAPLYDEKSKYVNFRWLWYRKNFFLSEICL